MIFAPERLRALVLCAQSHQSGHLMLGETDFLSAELSEADVLHLVGLSVRTHGEPGILGFGAYWHFCNACHDPFL